MPEDSNLGPQAGEVLDDLWMSAIRPSEDTCGVSVRVGRGPVGSPARVPDTQMCDRNRILSQFSFEVAQLARLLAPLQPVLGPHGDTGGVVAAVFHATQRVDQDVLRMSRSGIPDNSTHGF